MQSSDILHLLVCCSAMPLREGTTNGADSVSAACRVLSGSTPRTTRHARSCSVRRCSTAVTMRSGPRAPACLRSALWPAMTQTGAHIQLLTTVHGGTLSYADAAENMRSRTILLTRDMLPHITSPCVSCTGHWNFWRSRPTWSLTVYTARLFGSRCCSTKGTPSQLLQRYISSLTAAASTLRS
jgi:hypothetical protein